VTTRNTILDATTFAAVVAAETHGDERLSRTLTDVARPAFRTALKDWQAKRSGSSVPEGTPFDDASYREAAVATSRDLGTRADAGFASASAANANSDRFAMRAVLFALALFFLGIAGQLRARSARRLAVAMGALVLLSTLLSLTRLERAPRPERVSASDEPRRG